jgi:hypothetical protein
VEGIGNFRSALPGWLDGNAASLVDEIHRTARLDTAGRTELQKIITALVKDQSRSSKLSEAN